MKNFLKIALVSALLFSAPMSYANNEPFSLKVKSDNQKSIMFFVGEGQKVDLSIYDSNDQILYSQNIRTKTAAAKTYNLDAFPDGHYLLKLETDSEITEYQLQIENGKTLVEKPSITKKLKPVLTKENAIVTLNLDNAENGPVEIKIVNEFNDQLYNKIFTDSTKLNKKFNIGQSHARELTFIVRVKDQEFMQTLTVN